MKPLLYKEVRLILPAWIAALVLALGPAMLAPRDMLAECSFSCFALGAMLLGLASFGQECSFGTFSPLLAQPIHRIRVWRTKIATVSIAFITTLAVSALAYWARALPLTLERDSLEFILMCAFLGVVALTGGFWTTLLFRQVAPAFWFTMLVPFGIAIWTSKLWERALLSYAEAGLYALLLCYSIAGFVWARWMFLRAQDVQWTGGTLAVPKWLRVGRGEISPKRPEFHRAPFRAFLGKESRSHQVSLMIAGLLLLLHAIVILIRKSAYSPTESTSPISLLVEFWWVMWLGLPLLVGSEAVAEERKLGTLESQLCLPMKRGHQFGLKLLVALGFGILLGGVMPCAMEALGREAAPSISSIAAWDALLVLCLVCAGITFVAFYASTLSRNTLHAIGSAIGVGIALGGTIAWAVNTGQHTYVPPPWGIPLVAYTTLVVVVPTILLLALRNYQNPYLSPRNWTGNVVVLTLALLLAFSASAGLYNRPWELFLSLEPKHGPALLKGSVHPDVCGVSLKFFALLPDGRIWVATRHESQQFQQFVGGKTGWETISLPCPVGGTFLQMSNWIGLASIPTRAVGLQADGSLWTIFASRRAPWNDPRLLGAIPQPQRIGSETNWTAITSGNSHFLGLKTGGTVWGWGNNYNSQVGDGPPDSSDLPHQIGTDSDWKAIFASDAHSIGIKNDGSFWKWGRLDHGPNGWDGWKAGNYPEPVRWRFDADNWRVLDEYGFTKVVQRDGTLWVSGRLPTRIFGERFPYQLYPDLVQVGHETDWARIAGSYSALTALTRNGSLLYQYDSDAESSWFGGVQHPSKYSDWIALGPTDWGREVIALAADGTLCWWGNPFTTRALFAPTRKPLWALNLFATSKEPDPDAPGLGE